MNALVYSSSLVAAFLGGVLALFAPCCIVTLLPNFVGAAVQRGVRLLPVTGLVFCAGLATILLPIVLGVGAIGSTLGSYHRVVFLAVGAFLLVLGVQSVTGRRFTLPMPSLRVRARGGGFLSVYVLGVVSGVASSCCAPVVAGVVAMSALSASVAGSLGLGLAYIVGMVAPLLVATLVVARRGGVRARVRARNLQVAGRSVPVTDVVAGAMFAAVGAVTMWLGWTGQATYTPGPLADWDRWATARAADAAAALEGVPTAVQAAALGLLTLAVLVTTVRAALRTRGSHDGPPALPAAGGHPAGRAEALAPPARPTPPHPAPAGVAARVPDL